MRFRINVQRHCEERSDEAILNRMSSPNVLVGDPGTTSGFSCHKEGGQAIKDFGNDDGVASPAKKWRARNDNGFTFIEILMTMAVLAILFLPVMQLFTHSVFATADSMDLITATNLAKSHMERTLNLNLSKKILEKLGTEVEPPLDKPPLLMNKMHWRIKREFIKGSDPLEVRVYVYRDNDLDKPLVTLVTLIEDTSWEMVQAVSP